MNRMRKAAFRTVAPWVLLAAACGGEQRGRLEAELVAPEAREAKITLTPALEVSRFDEALLGRMVVEDIRLNLGDVRLLGADPRIPVGGLALLDMERVVESYDDDSGIDLPFPSQFLDDEDLAVYVRIDRSAALEGASVVVRARLYAEELRGGAGSLTAETHSATDPDGDPADDPEGIVGATDPDGDPALPPCDEATDPDGDPAAPEAECQRRGLIQRGTVQPYVTVELRDDRAADLVATLSEEDTTDVVVGIPATRWLTPEVIADLDAALDAHVADVIEHEQVTNDARTTIVVQSDNRRQGRVDRHTDDYFLSDTESLERQTVRR